jgi:hypothetical protein
MMTQSLSSAPSIAPTTGRGRRRHPRFDCGPFTFCLFQVCADTPLEVAGVRNVSQSGIGLITKRLLSAGSLVTLNLFNAQRNVAFRVFMRVIYAHSQDDGLYHVGGAFTEEISPEEVQWLV